MKEIVNLYVGFWIQLLALQLMHFIRIKQKIQRRRCIIKRKVKRRISTVINNHNIQTMQNMFFVVPWLIKIRERRFFKKSRSEEYWQKIVSKKFDEEEWIENFRVSKSIFTFICNSLHHELKKYDKAKRSLPTEKIVAVALYKLASCCEYRTVGSRFGIHKSTVHNCVYEFVRAINKVLRQQYIYFPNDSEAKEIACRIKNKTAVEQVFGFIDGKYWNWKIFSLHYILLYYRNSYSNITTKGWV